MGETAPQPGRRTPAGGLRAVDDPLSEPRVIWLDISEMPVPGVMLGRVLLRTNDTPSDPEIGWTTTDDDETW